MPSFALTPEVLSMIAGVILSLAFSYIPGLSQWFAGRDGTFKRLVMLLLLAISAAGLYGLSCGGILDGIARPVLDLYAAPGQLWARIDAGWVAVIYGSTLYQQIKRLA